MNYMIKVKFKLDYLNSLLVSYYILCLSSKDYLDCNLKLYSNFKISKIQSIRYLDYIKSLGFVSNKEQSMYRLNLFSPELKTIKKYCKVRKIPKAIENDLLSFEKQFKPYFLKLKNKLDPIIKLKKQNLSKLILTIYNSAINLTKKQIRVFKTIDIRVLEGISPSSFAKDYNDIQFIIEQVRNLSISNKFFEMTLIHELICHQIVKEYRVYYNDLFGKHIYEMEEGFAKLFAKKVFEDVFKENVNMNYYFIPSSELSYYKIYDKNWDLLKTQDFKTWYLNCLKEIKSI